VQTGERFWGSKSFGSKMLLMAEIVKQHQVITLIAVQINNCDQIWRKPTSRFSEENQQVASLKKTNKSLL